MHAFPSVHQQNLLDYLEGLSRGTDVLADAALSADNMLPGFETIDPNLVADHKACRPDQCYHSIDCSKLQCFRDMETPHIMLHEAASNAMADNREDMATAERQLAELDGYSNEMFRCLDEPKL